MLRLWESVLQNVPFITDSVEKIGFRVRIALKDSFQSHVASLLAVTFYRKPSIIS